MMNKGQQTLLITHSLISVEDGQIFSYTCMLYYVYSPCIHMLVCAQVFSVAFNFAGKCWQLTECCIIRLTDCKTLSIPTSPWREPQHQLRCLVLTSQQVHGLHQLSTSFRSSSSPCREAHHRFSGSRFVCRVRASSRPIPSTGFCQKGLS